MKIIFEWEEGRDARRTETEIPPNLSWEEVQNYTIQALKKALKYSNEPLPEGVTEGEL